MKSASTTTTGFYKKGQKKRKKAQSKSSGSEGTSPQIRKKTNTEPDSVFIEQSTSEMASEIENKIAMLDKTLQQSMKKMQDETVIQLKSFEFQELDLKMTNRVQELEERFESKVHGLEEKNAKLEETVSQIQRENTEMKAEMSCIKSELHSVKNHTIANEQYSRKTMLKYLDSKKKMEKTVL